jgi:hypothetical protein
MGREERFGHIRFQITDQTKQTLNPQNGERKNSTIRNERHSNHWGILGLAADRHAPGRSPVPRGGGRKNRVECMKTGDLRDDIPDTMSRDVANDGGPRAGSETSGVDLELGLQVIQGGNHYVVW